MNTRRCNIVKQLNLPNNYTLNLIKNADNRITYELIKIKKDDADPILKSLVDFANVRNAERSFYNMIDNIKNGKRKLYTLDIGRICGFYGKFDYYLKKGNEFVVASFKTYSTARSARRSFNNLLDKITIF